MPDTELEAQKSLPTSDDTEEEVLPEETPKECPVIKFKDYIMRLLCNMVN